MGSGSILIPPKSPLNQNIIYFGQAILYFLNVQKYHKFHIKVFNVNEVNMFHLHMKLLSNLMLTCKEVRTEV